MAIMVSIRKLGAKVTGVIRAVVPTTKRILEILLPTILPTAISDYGRKEMFIGDDV